MIVIVYLKGTTAKSFSTTMAQEAEKPVGPLKSAVTIYCLMCWKSLRSAGRQSEKLSSILNREIGYQVVGQSNYNKTPTPSFLIATLHHFKALLVPPQ